MLLQMARLQSFLWSNNIPSCIRVCVCVHICKCHINFIHSSVTRHLWYFHILAIVNSAAMNIEARVFFFHFSDADSFHYSNIG